MAIGGEVSAARGIVLWAVSEDVLNCLDPLTTRAGDLFWCMLREEVLCVRPYKGVTCDHSVKGGDCPSRVC